MKELKKSPLAWTDEAGVELLSLGKPAEVVPDKYGCFDIPLYIEELAQPVIPEQQTVQLAPHVYRELVNALRDVALEYHGAEQLRERISRTLSKALTAAHPHLSQPVQEMTYMTAAKRGIKTSNRDQWIKGYNAAINDGMLLSPAQPVSEHKPSYRDGLISAAKWVEKQREAYDSEHGQRDPDTGAFEFGNDAQRDYSSTLEEIAEGILGLVWEQNNAN